MNMNVNALEARACPACGSADAQTRYTVQTWRVVACVQCGFVYLPVAATTDYFAEGEGAWESSIRETHARKLKASPITARLSMATRFRTKFRKRTPVDYIVANVNAPQDNKLAVLDIGCGSGEYLASLDARFTPVGFNRRIGGRQRRERQFLDDVFPRHGVGHRVGGDTESCHDADERQYQSEQHAACRAAVEPA